MIAGVERAEFELICKDNVGLAGMFSVNPSSCENPSFYKDYLLYSAIGDLNRGDTTTHLFIDKIANRIMGFVSLRANSLITDDDSKSILGKPAIEIFMLAVDKDYERRKVGTTLIEFVLDEAYTLHNAHVGVRYLILAADNKAKGFYEKMDFGSINKIWKMPKDPWNINCSPMILELDFEASQFETFFDDSDDES